MAPRKRYDADIALAALAAVVAADGCNRRRSRTGPGQFFVFVRIVAAHPGLLWAGELRSFRADFACELGERAAMPAGGACGYASWGSARLYQLGVRGYKNAFAYSGLWDLYKALPQDNVVSCKPKHNM